MKYKFLFRPLIVLSVFSVLFSCSDTGKTDHKFTIRDLDKEAVFSFSIMSDNKGYAPSNNMDMKRCDAWIREAGDKFILGLGDHVKDSRDNPFLDLIKHDDLWHNKFYPNVADGENEYWGENQGDYGAGEPILEYVDLPLRSNVKVNPENFCEYYAVEEHGGVKVHIIQLYFSDTPKDPDVAFKESSREYLMNILDTIRKGDDDIIVVLAHTDHWVYVLTKEQQHKLLSKADLILDANKHYYRIYHPKKDTPANSALYINSGSVGNSGVSSGFLQIHVLKDPLRMIVQYQETKGGERELKSDSLALEKVIGGEITEVDWSKF
jgi:hypothetical protein